MKNQAQSKEPKQRMAFLNNYRAAVLAVMALFISFVASAQTDSLKYSQINGYGFKYKRHVQDSVSIIPLSTSPHTPYRAGGIRYRASDSTIQIWTGYQWNSIITGIGNGVDTAYALNDSIIAIETPDQDFYVTLPGRHWTLQQVLNNGSTLTENEVVTLADSLKFTSGFVIIDSLRLPALSAQTDTTVYKPLTIDASGNVSKMVGWPRTGISVNNASLDTVLRIGNIGLRGAVIGDSIIVQTDSSMFWGNSVTAGQNASPVGNRYVNLTAANLKTTAINKGISGTTLQKVSNGDSSMIDRLPTIPVWRNTLRYIMFDYGINDCDLDLGIAGFGTAYRRVIDSCIARGWPLSRIVVITPSIIGLNSFGKNIDSLRPFADTALAVAKAKGVHYADVFNYMINNGGASLISSDSIHPNNTGHYIMSQSIIYAVSTGSVKINGTLTMQRGDINLQGTAGNIIRWNNDASNINNLLFYDGGTTSSRVGIAKPTPNSQTGLALFVPDGTFNSQGIMLSVNTDASNTTQTTSSLAIKADKSVLINQPISLAAASNISYPVTATGNHNVFLVYNNGTTNQRTGFGKFAGDGSAGLVLFAQNGIGSPAGIALGSGQDATTMTTSNASVWLKPDNNVVVNLLKTGGTAPTTSGTIKNVVVDANGLLSFRDTTASGVVTGSGTSGRVAYWNGSSSLTSDANFTYNGELLIGSATDQGAFTLQNTGGLYQSGIVNLRGVLPPSASYNILVHDLTDSTVDQVPLSDIQGVTFINSQAGPAITISGDATNAISVSAATNTVTITSTTDLESFGTDANNTGTGETDLYSHTLAANKLTLNGKGVRFRITGTNNDATATAQIKGYFAGTNIFDSGALVMTAAGDWVIDMEIQRTTSTTAAATVTFSCANTTVTLPVKYTALTSQDWTTTNIFKVTGTAGGGGGGSNDITSHAGKVIFVP